MAFSMGATMILCLIFMLQYDFIRRQGYADYAYGGMSVSDYVPLHVRGAPKDQKDIVGKDHQQRHKAAGLAHDIVCADRQLFGTVAAHVPAFQEKVH